MIRLLLVDDEKTIRDGLSYAIDWDYHGFKVVGTAKNGLEALDFFKTSYADIIISDIRMPKMDGLCLQKTLLEKYPKLPFVFISGYQDFSYVSEALKQGASSYILKPVDTEELLSELKRVAKSNNLACENIPFKNLILKNLFSLEAEWDFSDYEFLKEEITDNFFCVLNIKCNYEDMLSSIFFLSFKQTIQTMLINTFCEDDVAFIEGTPRGIVYCVKGRDEYSLKEKFSKLANDLMSCLGDQSSNGFGIWTGGIYQGAEKIAESYVESFNTTNFILGNNANGFESLDLYSTLFTKEDEIITLLLARDLNGAQLLLEKDIISNPKLTPNDALFYFKHLIYRYTLALKENDSSLFIPPDLFNFNLLRGLTITEMFKITFDCIKEVYMISKPFIVNQSENYIAKVKVFIEENYQDPYLTLNTIATHIHLNPSYLCTEFAKQSGMGVIQYLTKTRLSHAKKLLLNTNKKINDISLQVGYLNSNYFSSLFRKQEHKTPSEFRKANLIQKE